MVIRFRIKHLKLSNYLERHIQTLSIENVDKLQKSKSILEDIIQKPQLIYGPKVNIQQLAAFRDADPPLGSGVCSLVT